MKKLVLAAATAATMMVSGTAQAVTFTYATYVQNAISQSLQFVNNGGPTASGTLQNNGAQTVKFKFFDDPSDGVPLPANLTTEQDAALTFSAVTTTAAMLGGPGGVLATQSFDSGSISFIATSGVDAGKNLVTINFTNLWLSGLLGANTASSITSTPYSTLNITSDFFDFSGSSAANFSLSMSATIPTLSLGANGVLSTFTADSSGTFASDPAPVYIPEPGMIGLFAAGAFGLAFARRRKK